MKSTNKKIMRKDHPSKTKILRILLKMSMKRRKDGLVRVMKKRQLRKIINLEL